MNKSPYKITMFILQIISLFLLLGLCIYFNIFSGLLEFLKSLELKEIFENPYISGVISSFISVYLLYIIQVEYCKNKIKKDFRCHEVIEDIQTGIDESTLLLAKEKTIITSNSQEENKDLYYDFYNLEKASFHLSNLIFTYDNNELLIDSVQSVFFINLNFKLLDIINNIKNRMPNIKKGYERIEDLYKQYEETKSDEIKMKLNFQVRHYLMDLNFMIQYWQKLLNYLKYNPLEVKTYSKIFNALYDTEEKRMDYYNALPEERKQINKKIRKIVKKEIRKKRTKGFFNKE